MDPRWCLIALHVFVFLIGSSNADVCSVAYTCYKWCYEKKRSTTRCYDGWKWFRCSSYRTTSHACGTTCHRRVCCDGWGGADCLTPLCQGLEECYNGGSCVDANVCVCLPGFEQPLCGDKNECDTNNGDCDHICTNTVGSYTCSCRTGYLSANNGRTCTDIDECATANGGCSQHCQNLPGTFECSCQPGFYLDTDGKTCIDINECYTDNGNCHQKCDNMDGSYQCSCFEGYQMANDGTTCIDLDECFDGSNDCDHNCTNTVGSFTCGCAEGYDLDLDERSCTDVDECVISESLCEQSCHNTDGSNYCSCAVGFDLLTDGRTCIDIIECELDNGNCEYSCTNEVGSYTCGCQSGYRLADDRHSCHEVDECSEGISGCAQNCTNTIGSYTCGCTDGYVLGADGNTCNDIDYCEGVSCDNGGTCSDGLATFTCVCAAGFIGDLCEQDVIECDVFNGGCQDTCTNTFGSYSCSCRENKTLAADGVSCTGTSPQDSVFRRHNIAGRTLPKGCWTIPVDLDIDGTPLPMSLSSTSEWYSLDSDGNVRYTHGIVYATDGQLSVPISLDGLEVHQTPTYRTEAGVSNELKNKGSVTGTFNQGNCLSTEFSSSDIYEFIEAGSFVRSMFASIQTLLPNWIRFESLGANLIHVQDLKSEMIYGHELTSDPWCKGAPVFPNHLYSLFKFGTNFALEVYGKRFVAPDILSGDKFCLIIDMCENCGATLFLMIPKESNALLSEMGMFEDQLTDVAVVGFGISLMGGINVLSHSSDLELWNGNNMFTYQIEPLANIWLGTELYFNDSVSYHEYLIDAFLTIPNLVDIFSGAYFDEWHGLVTLRSVAIRLRFKLLGERAEISLHLDDFLSLAVDAYVSYGGSFERTVCGEMANPAGQFVAVTLRINPFLNVPLLRDWIYDAHVKVFAFFLTNQTPNLDSDQPLDTSNLVAACQSSLSRFKIVLNDILSNINEYAAETVKDLVADTEVTIMKIVEALEEQLRNFATGQLSEKVNVISEMWQQLSDIQRHVDIFLDSIESYIDAVSDTLITSIRSETSKLVNSFNSIILRVSNHVTSQLSNTNNGNGYKFKASVSVFGLKLGWLSVEYVNSTDAFHCSRFDKLNNIYKGQNTTIIILESAVDFPIGYFLAGVGGGIVAVENMDEKTLYLKTFVRILGVSVTADMFINLKGLFIYTELKVWDTFFAQVDIFAELGNNWYELTLQVQARFAGKSRERRQVQTKSETFDSSLLGALINVVNQISDETMARLDGAKHALTSVQSKFEEAKQWLEGKKAEVRYANQYFDKVIGDLEEVERGLEKAKQPYNDAIDKLNDAQKDLDALCKVKRCNDICFPGLKCKICKLDLWIVKIPYPCCRTDGCMWRFPDPVCIAKNSMCYLAKGAAYVALEVAKEGVQVAMAPYDVAQLAVSAATLVVDKSRAVLTLAEGALSLAQSGFEGAKGALEAAKSALDVIKGVVGFAADIMEYVLRQGADNILDVRDCGFGIELSTKDLAVFDVTCKIKAFNLGWKTIRIRINFKNILQSIWQAAKATINAIIDGFGGIVRKRRDIGFHSAVSVHKLLRNVRSSENILNDTANATQNVIDTLKFTDGFKTDVQSDYENRVDLFEAKCDTIANVLSFLNETFQTLFYVANETQRGIDESLLTVSDLRTYNRSDIANNLTLENAGISIEHAMNDYNISEADLEQVLNRTKYQIFDDPILNEVDEMVELARNGIDSELSVAESVQILNQWLFAMENTTNTYFADTECLRFRDCVYHSMALLYELYTEEDGIPEIDTIRETIDALENVILDVLQNSSSSITEALNASSEIMSDIRYLTESNQFCSKPPVFTVIMQNVTAELGSSVVIACDVVAEPKPVFWWFRNGSLVEEQRTATFAIHNVTHGDVATYRCTAGNIVANLSSDEVHLKVIAFHYPVDTALETGYIILIAVLSSCCVVLALAVLVFVRYKRRRATKTRMLNIELRHKAFDNCGYAVGTAEKDRKPDTAEETVLY